MARGNDFNARGTKASLDLYEQSLVKHFDLKLRGCAGKGVEDFKWNPGTQQYSAL